jgi:cytochrome c oxidase assembly factor CtaG
VVPGSIVYVMGPIIHVHVENYYLFDNAFLFWWEILYQLKKKKQITKLKSTNTTKWDFDSNY